MARNREGGEAMSEVNADDVDPVIEAYKKDVDRTLLRENLKLTVEQRLLKLAKFAEFAAELREAGRRHRESR
jgi:hypothetical protein